MTEGTTKGASSQERSEAVQRQPKFVLEPHPGNLRPGINDQYLNDLIWEMDEERLARKDASTES